jgi:pimeloyl-ACP methyl ester carboxylesterase
MPVYRYGSLALHYLERGRGAHVVLVHGLGSSGADWAFQVPALEQHRRVIVPDLPGSGHSAPLAAGPSIAGYAAALWRLLDALGHAQVDLVGFSLGGAVALEMALERPAAVPRLALINSLASYRADHWRKWLEARVPAALVRVLGMPRTAQMVARRVFPHPWQHPMRERASRVIGEVPAATYLGMARALERWSATDRLDRLRSRTLLIAAEHDYTPLAEKRVLAARIGAELVVVQGSRHGTPFDATALTNACLVALLTGQALPPQAAWVRDAPETAPVAPPPASLAEEHAAGPSSGS